MEENKNKDYISSMVFVGCMFIGLALGLLMDKTGMGVMLGMGVGFIAMAYIENKKKKDSGNQHD